MVSTSFPREILVHESTELGCWEVVSVSESRRPPTSRTTTRARIEQKRANDIEIALARPKQTRLRRRPEQAFSCHQSLRDLSTTSKEANRVEGRRHIAIVPWTNIPEQRTNDHNPWHSQTTAVWESCRPRLSHNDSPSSHLTNPVPSRTVLHKSQTPG